MPAGTDPEVVEQRIVEAGVLLARYGAVTGWASLRWHGGAWFGGLDRRGLQPVPVTIVIASEDIRPHPGVRLSAERLARAEIAVVDGLPVTGPVRSACFEARYADDVRQAVEILDMAAYSDLVDVSGMVLFAATLNGWTGVPQLRAALLLVDENSWSPMETQVRLVWVLDAELPWPFCNQPVFDRSGRHLGTPDLLDEEAGLVVEYDGMLHLENARRRKDRDRDEQYRRHGLDVITVVGADLADRDRLVTRFYEARGRAAFAAVGARPWTTVAPSWWIRTDTVERRRALDAELRDRWLRLRLRVG